MQATRKVIIADESREFAVPCASLLKGFGVEAVLVPKDGEALYEALLRRSRRLFYAMCSCLTATRLA